MLVHLRSEQFKPEYLKYVHQDPVHSLTENRSLERRCRFDRNIFFWIENDVPTAVLCVAYIRGLTDDVGEILDVTSPVCMNADHAIFQHTWVRPSSKYYLTFSLVMDRSPGFGSNPSD